jgi:hypothetical protein
MPGMVCKVAVQNFDPRNDTETTEIVVPNRVIQISADGLQYVWLADGNRATRQFVKTAGLNDHGIVVIDGLSEGDKLIVEGFGKISEGMKISY